MNCKSCRYFLPLDNAMGVTGREDAGNCLRYPPTPLRYPVQVERTPANPQGVAMASEGVRPPVYGDVHWCGEWTARTEPS